ncbi:hypothetical protein BH11ACT5_BH11ACT5_03050 [soil metagenome]
MEILRQVLFVLHLVGLASLLGGVLVQITAIRARTARVLPAIMHGAWLQLVTGIALVGVISAGTDDHVDNVKIAVKLAIVIAITVIAFINRKKTTPPVWVVPTIGVLTLANVVIAVFWR